MSFIENHLKLMIGIFAIAFFMVSCFFFYTRGRNDAADKYKALMAEADKVHAQQLVATTNVYRLREQNHAAEIASIDKHYTEQLKNVQSKNKADIAALRSGTLQLQQRFVGQNTGSTMSTTVPCTGMGDGTGRGGLQPADAEFLVSEAGRADEIVIRLQASQQILSADRTLETKEQ